MKKIMIFVLVLSLIALPAIGEGLDLSSMSYDALLELRDGVCAELKTRPEYSTETGYSGLLIGGKSIAVGSYTLTCVGDTIISIWFSESGYGLRNEPNSEAQYVDGTNVLVYIEEDTYIVIEGGSVYIQSTKEDWTPKVE